MNKENSPQPKPDLKQAIMQMTDEGGENFLRYIKNIGLSSEQNILVLSSSQHYYYDESDLRSIRALVNLKKLNMVRHLDKFLHNLYRILPPEASFVGCFSDAGTSRFRIAKYSYPTRGLLNSIRNIFGSMTEPRMSKNEVSEILKTHGFKIVDMTEMNGVTFFWSLNVRRPYQKQAG